MPAYAMKGNVKRGKANNYAGAKRKINQTRVCGQNTHGKEFPW